MSEGFQLRTAYKKKVKPSKLDGLLERRVKQFTLEEKQRLERMRQAALLSKTAATKLASTCKTEESTLGKQQPTGTPCVKEEEESLQLKDHVVKKLDFEQEQTELKKENLDVKAETTALEQTENNTVQGNGGEALKGVNGGSPTNVELGSKNNCVSDTKESKKEEGMEENSKKHRYEQIMEGSGQSDTENMEVDQSKTSPAQMNGTVGVGATADSDQASQVQCDNKEPLKSLMNGNLSQNDLSECHPPPLKVPKLENHVAEKGDQPVKNEDVVKNSEGTEPGKLPSSSPSCPSSNSTKSDGVKTMSAESQNAPQSNAMSQAASSTVSTFTTTTQPTSKAVLPQKAKAPASDGKMAASGSTTSSSMTISKEYSTRDKVSLLKFSKTKKARSGTALPSYRKFVTKSSKKSIFILPNDDLKRLARRGSIREVPIFNYSAKPAPDIWPYPSPRPTFGITWRLIYFFLLKAFGNCNVLFREDT